MVSEQQVASKQITRFIGSPLPKLLVLTHAMGGGVARHLVEVSSALRDRAHVVQVIPDGVVLRFVIPGLTKDESEVHLAFQWPGQQELFWRFVDQLGIVQVHVHHVFNWPADFWPVFLRKMPGFDLTLHDHCIFSHVSGDDCTDAEELKWLVRVQRCFGGKKRWESRCLYQLASAARRVFVPSRAMHGRICQYFPELGTYRLLYQPHPEAELLQGEYPAPYTRPLSADQPLRVLCLGMLSAEKGAQVLARVARQAHKAGMPFEFHLLGSCHVHLPGYIIKHGSYEDRQVPGLLETIDPHVLWLPAQHPETWSYTLSAGLVAGLPIVATNIGAFPERLQHRPLSWLCDVELSVSEWLGVLLAVRERHQARRGLMYSWRNKKTKPFYTALANGYLLVNEQSPCEKLPPLTGWQISQALVEGLPEASQWRDRLLRLLLRLKYSPMLAPLVKLIPYTWQRQLKRLISRAPLHEPPVADNGRENR